MRLTKYCFVKTMLLKWNPEFDAIIQDSIDDPRYYVVTDMMDSEV